MREGIRGRFVVRRSDGSQTSKRGFTGRRAAADARRRLVEQVERREVARLHVVARAPAPLCLSSIKASAHTHR
jgi:hypothetical protein